MRLWAILHTEAIEEILYGLTGHAGANLRPIARLTIQIALETLLCEGVWIVTKRAIADAIRGIPLLLLENDLICHVIRCICWATGVALTTSKERKIVCTNNAVLVPGAIAKLTSGITPNITNFDVLMPFRAQMCEDAKLILDASN
jgi:hypothetical protein